MEHKPGIPGVDGMALQGAVVTVLICCLPLIVDRASVRACKAMDHGCSLNISLGAIRLEIFKNH